MALDIIAEANTLLESYGYSCRAGESDHWLYFEDVSLVGFVAVAPTAGELIASWESRQMDFLHRHAARFRLLGQKSWNVYAVYLTSAKAAAQDLENLRRIEEDLESTRKIARTGIESADDLIRALYPLVPVQTLVSQYRPDPLPELRNRLLGELPPRAVTLLLEGGDPTALADSVTDAKA